MTLELKESLRSYDFLDKMLCMDMNQKREVFTTYKGNFRVWQSLYFRKCKKTFGFDNPHALHLKDLFALLLGVLGLIKSNNIMM